MNNKEFHTTPIGEVMIGNFENAKILNIGDRDFICWWISTIKEKWPDAYIGLEIKFNHLKGNNHLFEFRIVRQFLKCNFGNYDRSFDIDAKGKFNFEEVICPLRGGDCRLENICCKPKFNSGLSKRELEVMELYFKGLNPDVIASKLYISEDTVVTHKKHVFKRLDLHSLAEFFNYAINNNLFN